MTEFCAALRKIARKSLVHGDERPLRYNSTGFPCAESFLRMKKNFVSGDGGRNLVDERTERRLSTPFRVCWCLSPINQVSKQQDYGTWRNTFNVSISREGQAGHCEAVCGVTIPKSKPTLGTETVYGWVPSLPSSSTWKSWRWSRKPAPTTPPRDYAERGTDLIWSSTSQKLSSQVCGLVSLHQVKESNPKGRLRCRKKQHRAGPPHG